MAITAAQQNFINTLAPMAVKSWQETGVVLPSITLAQGILESGWGTTELAKNANNLFGIKVGDNWSGQSYTVTTPEYVNGKKTYVKAAFRKYPSWQGSVDDHTTFLTKKRYSNIVGNKNADQVAKLLQQDGYATDPNYPNKLINIINTYNLKQYDTATEGSTTTTSNNKKKTVYTVQVGAFAIKKNADIMCDSMKNKGYIDSFIIYNPVDKLYRVQLGAFSVKSNAIALQNKLKTHKLKSIIKEKYV